jgi:hypothetical protein
VATPRTRRLIKVGDDSARLNAAIRSRRRLQKEATTLLGDIDRLTTRLNEVNEEEGVISAAIEAHAGKIATAHAEPDDKPDPVKEGDLSEESGYHS